MITFISIADDIIQELPFTAVTAADNLVEICAQITLLGPDGWRVTHLRLEENGDVEVIIEPDLREVLS